MERLGVDALDVDAAQMTHVQVWLIDQHDRNPHIDAVLLGAAQAIAKLRAAGKEVRALPRDALADL